MRTPQLKHYLTGHNCTILDLAYNSCGTRFGDPDLISLLVLSRQGPRRINVGRQKTGRFGEESAPAAAA